MGVIQFAETSYDVVEGEYVTISVVRSHGGGIIEAGYTTSDGTAVSGSDYPATSGRVTFARRTTNQDIKIFIADDNLAEGQESFTVTLTESRPTGVSS